MHRPSNGGIVVVPPPITHYPSYASPPPTLQISCSQAKVQPYIKLFYCIELQDLFYERNII